MVRISLSRNAVNFEHYIHELSKQIHDPIFKKELEFARDNAKEIEANHGKIIALRSQGRMAHSRRDTKSYAETKRELTRVGNEIKAAQNRYSKNRRYLNKYKKRNIDPYLREMHKIRF